MDSFKVEVIDDQYQSKTLELPNATVGSLPEYPSTWFDTNHGRPRLKIPKAIDQDPITWAKMLGFALSSGPTQNIAVRYVYDFAYLNFAATPSATWTSYGREIGLKDKAMNPFQMLEVIEGNADWAAEEAHKITPDEEWRLFFILIAGYRYGLAAEVTQGSYKTTVLGKINQVLRGEPFQLDEDLSIGEITACKVWYTNLEFRMMIAVLDMFWMKFPDSPYAKLRVCTLNSRYKDCSSLSEIKHFSDLTSLSIGDSFQFIFSTRVRDEVIGIGRPGEESAKANSYFPYMRKMRISKKSPYSSSVNVNLHNWIAMFGALLGSDRSYNARIVSESGLSQTMNLTLFAAFAFKKNVNAKQVFGESDAAESARLIAEMEDEGDSNGRRRLEPSSPLGVLKHMKDCRGIVPDEVKTIFISSLNKMPPPREGTIGSYLRTNLV